jgi:hypothetical protein
MMVMTAGLAAWVAGCTVSGGSSATSRPTDWNQQAKNDPFNYNPDINDWPSVSGGGINHLDRDAFNRDMDHVLNP